MTTEGWVFMVLSIGFVLTLTGFCFYKVLTKPAAANHMQAPIEIDTRDRDT